MSEKANLLQRILEINKSYLAGTRTTLESAGEPFLVVSCLDPRLTGLLEPAMGLARHRTLVIRVAGNRITDGDGGTLRSVATAVLLKAAMEAFVVGHTDCKLAAFPTAEIVERFRSFGIARSEFGSADLREWFGAFGSVRANVIAGVRALRECRFLPRSLVVHGLILDSESGALTLLEEGYGRTSVPAPQEPPKDAAEAGKATQEEKAEERREPAPAPRPGPAASTPGAGAPPPAPPPINALQAVWILKEIVAQEKHDPHLRRAFGDFRALLRRERDPARLVDALEQAALGLQERYPRLPALLAYLRWQARAGDSEGGTILDVLRKVL